MNQQKIIDKSSDDYLIDDTEWFLPEGSEAELSTTEDRVKEISKHPLLYANYLKLIRNAGVSIFILIICGNFFCGCKEKKNQNMDNSVKIQEFVKIQENEEDILKRIRKIENEIDLNIKPKLEASPGDISVYNSPNEKGYLKISFPTLISWKHIDKLIEEIKRIHVEKYSGMPIYIEWIKEK